MGEIADMLLDGVLCGQCGDVLDGHSPGHPRLCGGCRRREEDWERDPIDECTCPVCEKVLKSFNGARDHIMAKHPDDPTFVEVTLGDELVETGEFTLDEAILIADKYGIDEDNCRRWLAAYIRIGALKRVGRDGYRMCDLDD